MLTKVNTTPKSSTPPTTQISNSKDGNNEFSTKNVHSSSAKMLTNAYTPTLDVVDARIIHKHELKLNNSDNIVLVDSAYTLDPSSSAQSSNTQSSNTQSSNPNDLKSNVHYNAPLITLQNPINGYNFLQYNKSDYTASTDQKIPESLRRRSLDLNALKSDLSYPVPLTASPGSTNSYNVWQHKKFDYPASTDQKIPESSRRKSSNANIEESSGDIHPSLNNKNEENEEDVTHFLSSPCAIDFVKRFSNELVIHMTEDSESELFALESEPSEYLFEISDQEEDSTTKSNPNKKNNVFSKKEDKNKHKEKQIAPLKSELQSDESDEADEADKADEFNSPTANKTKKTRKKNVSKIKKGKIENAASKGKNKRNVNVKYSKIIDLSGDTSDSEESDENSNVKGRFFRVGKKRSAIMFAGAALGFGGLVGAMKNGGALSGAVGGLLGISVALSHESSIEGDDNIVIGGGSSSLLSFNYLYKNANPELIDSLNEKNQLECLKVGMYYQDSVDGAYYGWSSQHNSPACLMNIPLEMVRGYCRRLVIPDSKTIGTRIVTHPLKGMNSQVVQKPEAQVQPQIQEQEQEQEQEQKIQPQNPTTQEMSRRDANKAKEKKIKAEKDKKRQENIENQQNIERDQRKLDKTNKRIIQDSQMTNKTTLSMLNLFRGTKANQDDLKKGEEWIKQTKK